MATKDFFSEEFFLEAIEQIMEQKDPDNSTFDNTVSKLKEGNKKGAKLSMKNILKNTSMYNEDKDTSSDYTADNTTTSPFFQTKKGSTKSINEFLKTPMHNKKASTSKFYMSSNFITGNTNFNIKNQNELTESTRKFSNKLLKGYKDKIEMMKQSEFVKLQVITEDKYYTPNLKRKTDENDDLDNKFQFMLS
jgi:hypothetical protein